MPHPLLTYAAPSWTGAAIRRTAAAFIGRLHALRPDTACHSGTGRAARAQGEPSRAWALDLPQKDAPAFRHLAHVETRPATLHRGVQVSTSNRCDPLREDCFYKIECPGPKIGSWVNFARCTGEVGCRPREGVRWRVLEASGRSPAGHRRTVIRGDRSTDAAKIVACGGTEAREVRCAVGGTTEVNAVSAQMPYDALLDTAEVLRNQAERCRRLARYTIDAEVVRRLLDLAHEFELRAGAAEDRVRE